MYWTPVVLITTTLAPSLATTLYRSGEKVGSVLFFLCCASNTTSPMPMLDSFAPRTESAYCLLISLYSASLSRISVASTPLKDLVHRPGNIPRYFQPVINPLLSAQILRHRPDSSHSLRTRPGLCIAAFPGTNRERCTVRMANEHTDTSRIR